jgi:signal transduction histidine kinase
MPSSEPGEEASVPSGVADAEEMNRALLNILTDFEAEQTRIASTQRATFNILDDFESEKARLEESQRATLNIFDDFESERARLQRAQRATFNILEDYESEQARLQDTQGATFNILEDFNSEKARLELTQVATLNILDDLEFEKQKVERAERQLIVRAEELGRSNRDLEAFAYSISHDLRAPLRAIDGFSKILLADYADRLPEEAQRFSRLIVESVAEMGQLVEDLLAFSRLGRQSITRRDVDIAGLARQVIDELAPQYSGREVQVNVEEVPACRADANLMKQVLINLLSNAFKYTRKRPQAEVEVGWLADESAYYVQDNGVGFDMKYADKLYGVFQRLHRAEDYEGTGVGLAIVHRIVTRHGGRIWAKAAVDEGATFYFTVPEADING